MLPTGNLRPGLCGNSCSAPLAPVIAVYADQGGGSAPDRGKSGKTGFLHLVKRFLGQAVIAGHCIGCHGQYHGLGDSLAHSINVSVWTLYWKSRGTKGSCSGVEWSNIRSIPSQPATAPRASLALSIPQ